MNSINNRISTNDILIIEEKSDKKSILKAIAAKVSKNTGVAENAIYTGLKNREKLSSTGFGKGIAIPHCQLESISDFNVGIVLAKEGVDFNALDGKPVQIFFYIIGNKDQKSEHIRILSNASKMLSDSLFLAKLLKAKTVEDIEYEIKIISQKESQEVQPTEKMLVQIATSNEELFNQFLQTAVSLEIESMIVIEGVSASNYLYKLPIFSSFWTDRAENDRKVVLLSVDKALANNLIREFHLIPDFEKMESEFMINVIPLYYSAGKLGL